MDLQNVVYRYFADSARYFKKIAHGIRKGEAELLVICDGETPLDDDLKMVFEEHLGAVKTFRSWSATKREEARVEMHDLFKKSEDEKAQEQMALMAGGAALASGGVASGVAAAGGTAVAASGVAGLAVTAVVAVGAAAVVVGSKICEQIPGGLCASDRKAPREKVMTSWEKTREAEEDILDFLTSLTKDFNLSFKKALKHTQDLRSELNVFLLLLEERGLIFGPSSMMASTSRFPENQRQYGNQRCEPEE